MEYIKQPEGACTSTIEAVAAKYSVEIPADLREFWLKSDGCILWFGYKELQFFKTIEILEEDNYNLRRYMPNSLPICVDGNGNLCIARIEIGKIMGYFVASCGNLDWEDAIEISKSFREFVLDPKSPEHRLFA